MEPEFVRFNQLKEIRFDYHIHTAQTDGTGTIEEYIQAAIQKKLKSIAFTEHVRRDSKWFDSFVKRVKSIRKNYDFKIYYGIEAKAINFKGNIDATPHMIKESEIVLGAVHRYPDGKNGLVDIRTISEKEAAKIEFKLALGLLKYGKIDVLAHVGGFFELYFFQFPEQYLRRLFKESIKRKIAIGFNGNYIKNKKIFFELCREVNPYISIGSDAHIISDLGNGIDIIKMELK